MFRSAPSSLTSTRSLLVALVALLALHFSACGSDHDHSHANATRVELQTRGAVPTLLAVWTDEDGWQDPAGQPLTELPNPIVVDGSDELLPLTAGGPNASLSAIYYDEQGEVIPMSTLERDNDTQERTCSEYWGRYQPDDNATSVIAWPAIPHPDSTQRRPSAQFAELSSGDLVAIFHCDHLHIYPKAEGAVPVRFLLWHVDHADGSTDPLTIRVHAAMSEDSQEHGDSHGHDSHGHDSHGHSH
ncbi:MAG: hypothetical protein EA398_09405 [Deltaproteobacteria bacterium]|nr:MAG: hypothetical protein EA398_09405 [Deltaproteobacteria bacterium]